MRGSEPRPHRAPVAIHALVGRVAFVRYPTKIEIRTLPKVLTEIFRAGAGRCGLAKKQRDSYPPFHEHLRVFIGEHGGRF